MKKSRIKKKLNKALITGLLGLAAVLIFFFLSSSNSVEAVDSMEISSGGTLVRYPVDDGERRVKLPNSITAIGTEAFSGDQTLEAIEIPSGVKTIGEKAFYDCPNLREVTIEEGVEGIKDGAFSLCTSLRKINLPKSLRTVGNGIFAGDSLLDNVTLSPESAGFFLSDNVLYSKDGTRLIQMMPGRGKETFEMPDSVKAVLPYAFWGAKNLKKLYLSGSLTSVTPFSFTNASELEFAYLPRGIKSIEEYAFRDCGKLKYVGAQNAGCTADGSSFQSAGEGFAFETGVSLSEAERAYGALLNSSGSDTEVNNINTVSDNKKGGNRGSESENGTGEGSISNHHNGAGDGGSAANGSNNIVIDTPWGIHAPYRDIDPSTPGDLYGMGKILDGKTLIIPAK